MTIAFAGRVTLKTLADCGKWDRLLPEVKWGFPLGSEVVKRLVARGHKVVAVTVLFVPLVILMMKGAETIRFVNLSGAGQEGYGDKGDMMTSGRVSMWKRNIETMSPLQIAVGRGMAKYSYSDDVNERRAGRVTAGNAHSMIMTVLYNSGIAGLVLFLAFLSVSAARGLKMGDRGRMALLFIGTWLFSGLAESWGMVGGSSALLCGFGIGLLSHRVARNSEFDERADPWAVFTRENMRLPPQAKA